MPNLICFPHYTCGGLLCDIMNDTMSPVDANGAIMSKAHNLGKIGDVDTVCVDYDMNKLLAQLDNLKLTADSWIATHCWPSSLLLSKFQTVIMVTTATSRSRIYRWARAYHHYFLPQWQDLRDMQLIDKARETAKNYLVPFSPIQAPNVLNLEFADVVEHSQEFLHTIHQTNSDRHTQRWQRVNHFLYDSNFWNSDPARHYYTAEFEVELDRFYRYN